MSVEDMSDDELLRSALSDLAAQSKSEAAPARVEAALLQAFRRRHRSTGKARVVWAAAIAASLLVAAGMWFARGKSEQMPASVVRPAPPVTPPSPEVRPDVTPNVVRAAAPARRRARPAAPRLQEVATEFFPLRGGIVFEPNDPARLIRIRLPRSEIRRFGLPVGVDFERTPVDADVLIGQDGVARAVRFVSAQRIAP